MKPCHDQLNPNQTGVFFWSVPRSVIDWGAEAFEELVLTMTIDGNPETTTKTPKT
mgnify:CR=1 FL=1